MYTWYRFLSLFCLYCMVNTKIRKRKVLNEFHLKEELLSLLGELLGRVNKLFCGDNVIVKCTDGMVRSCYTTANIKQRIGIRENDLVLVARWDFKSGGASIKCRCGTANVDNLEQRGYLATLDLIGDK